MRKLVLAAALTTGMMGLGMSAASAMPLDRSVSGATINHEQVRLVCNEFGRCWRTGPRYRYGYRYAPRYRYGYGPRYSYYGPGYRYYDRGYYGGPGVSLRFGF